MVKLWSNEPRPSPDILQGHTDWVWSIAHSPTDQSLASGSMDGTLRLWDLRTGVGQAIAPTQPHDILWIAFSPDGRLLAVGESDWRYARTKEAEAPPRLKLWPVPQPREATGPPVSDYSNLPSFLPGSDGWSRGGVAFSPDGKMVVGAHIDQVMFWSVPDGKEVARVQKKGWFFGLEYSPDGRWFATVLGNGPTTLFDAATRKEVVNLADDPNVGWCTPLAFSPDSKLLAWGSSRLRLWHIATKQATVFPEGHKGPLMCIRFSPDGKTIATGSLDHAVKLWNAEKLQEVATFEGHTGVVSGLSFSPDGTQLASSGEDATIRLWRAISPAEAARVERPTPK
jgi:WD40 repeat protein